jgi:hypothetical protein
MKEFVNKSIDKKMLNSRTNILIGDILKSQNQEENL